MIRSKQNGVSYDEVAREMNVSRETITNISQGDLKLMNVAQIKTQRVTKVNIGKRMQMRSD